MELIYNWDFIHFYLCDEKQQGVHGMWLQYLTEERKKTSIEVLRFSQSDSSIPASLLSFYICGVTMATMKTFYKI